MPDFDRKQISEEELFTKMEAAAIPSEYHRQLLGNNFNKVPTLHVQKWYNVKESLQRQGYTHLPTGDDL